MSRAVASVNYFSFQPAFDVFHTEFRFLRLRRLLSSEVPWHYDQLRIADFYLLFFFRLQDVRLSPQHRSFKKLARLSGEQRYEHQPDDQLIFNRMENIQLAAMGTLVANGFFDVECNQRNLVVEGERNEPPLLAARIDEANLLDMQQLEAINALLTSYELLGRDGIKARTGLMEYRYDAD